MATVEGRILGSNPKAKAGIIFEKPGVKREPENPDNLWIEKLQMLLPPFRIVRYEPFTGKLHLASYHQKATRPGVDFKRWSPHTSIESVTGVSAEIVNRYREGGEVAGKTLALRQFVQERLQDFGTDDPITSEFLTELHQDTMIEIDHLGFSTARKPSKAAIAKQVEAGVNFDSKNRRNPLISRVRLASSLLKLYVEQRFEDEVLSKYFDLFFRLLDEQSLEEAVVQTILDEFSQGNFTPQILKEAWLKQTVKAAPYRLPVMQAFITQFGASNFATAKYFENDELLLEALNDPGIALDDRRAIIIKNLKTALDDGQSIYYV